MMECEQLLIMLQKLPSTYAKANFVQKQLIAKMLDLNIKINEKKRLTITVNPIFDDFFTHNGGRTWT